MMQTRTFSIFRAYEIKCKLFIPDDLEVKHIIVGVHGFAGDKESSMLERLASGCSSKGVALLCFDFPAHGESPVHEEMLTVENCKQDLLAVFDHASGLYPDATKSVFATSFGGYVTLLCADQLSSCPLVLRAPAVTMPKLLLQTVLGITQEQFQAAGHITCGFERPIHLPYAFAEELQRQEDLSAKAIEQSTLIIHGDCDDIVPLEDIKSFAAHQKTVFLEIVLGADHRFKKSGELEKILCLTKQFLEL